MSLSATRLYNCTVHGAVPVCGALRCRRVQGAHTAPARVRARGAPSSVSSFMPFLFFVFMHVSWSMSSTSVVAIATKIYRPESVPRALRVCVRCKSIICTPSRELPNSDGTQNLHKNCASGARASAAPHRGSHAQLGSGEACACILGRPPPHEDEVYGDRRHVTRRRLRTRGLRQPLE